MRGNVCTEFMCAWDSLSHKSPPIKHHGDTADTAFTNCIHHGGSDQRSAFGYSRCMMASSATVKRIIWHQP
eukprot:8341957-Pyramimonas_sp.AAC.1